MSKYQFGSIVDRDFRRTLQRLADDAAAQGKAIQDLVADGQLTPEQYAQLITVVNGNLKSGEVSMYDLNKNQFNLDGTWFSSDFLRDLNNGVINTTNVLPESVTKRELANKAVTIEKTDFIDVSTNMADVRTATTGRVQESDGEIIDSPSRFVTRMIPVTPNGVYTVKDVEAVAHYKADGQFNNIFYPASPRTVTLDSQAHFVRLVILKDYAASAQMNKGEKLLPYEPFYATLQDRIDFNLLDDYVEEKHVKDGAITKDKTSFIQKSSNLFNKDAAALDTNFENGTGLEIPSSIYALSEFIEVNPSDVYSILHVFKLARYDADRNYLINYYPDPPDEPSAFVTTNNTHYVRLAVRKELLNDAQMNQGETLLDYEPFGYFMDPDIKVAEAHTPPENPEDPNINDIIEQDFYVVDGKTDGTYAGPEIQYWGLHYNTQKTYDLYDALMARHPNYITRRSLGIDVTSQHIYCYEFKPKPVPTHGEGDSMNNTKFPKIIMDSGIHGEEKAGVYNLLHAMSEIADNWRDNELLETLRWNAHFIIVPVVSPYGMDESIRHNENGVDLNRNFPLYWENNTAVEGDSTWGGPEPLSEVSSQAIANLLEENTDAIYYGNVHNMWEPERFIWVPGSNKFQVNLAKRLVSKMTREWQKRYSWMPQDDDFHYGYAHFSSSSPTSAKYAASLGIPASTFETSAKVGFYPENGENFSDAALTMGAETIINWLVLVLRENTEFFNRSK